MISRSHPLRLRLPLPLAASRPPRADLGAARGIVWGAGLGAVIWAVILYAWLG
jgi:hypothetical protein